MLAHCYLIVVVEEENLAVIDIAQWPENEIAATIAAYDWLGN
jgi:hypothetical protein